MMPLGFFNLQAVNIGLNVGDVGVVSILVTVFSLTLNPVIGKKLTQSVLTQIKLNNFQDTVQTDLAINLPFLSMDCS